MDKRLENLRMYFPAEVTASFVAIQGLLTANNVGPSEYMWFMVWVVVALAALNVAIYWRFYDIKSLFLQVILGIGFINGPRTLIYHALKTSLTSVTTSRLQLLVCSFSTPC
jgi:hypothetical protein